MESCFNINSDGCTGCRFQILGAATENARLPMFNLVLGTKFFWEINDLWLRKVQETNEIRAGYYSPGYLRWRTLCQHDVAQYRHGCLSDPMNCTHSVP